MMALTAMAGRWARTALVWFVATILFGMYMGMTQQFHLSSPHAHMGLLGWVSSALFAFIHGLAGDGVGGRGPVVHWVAHNLGLATMVTGMFLTARHGPAAWTMLIPLGGIVVVIATLWLAWRFWGRLGVRRAAG